MVSYGSKFTLFSQTAPPIPDKFKHLAKKKNPALPGRVLNMKNSLLYFTSHTSPLLSKSSMQ